MNSQNLTLQSGNPESARCLVNPRVPIEAPINFRDHLSNALMVNPHDAAAVLRILKQLPTFSEYFAQDAKVCDTHFSIERHTHAVLSQHYRYHDCADNLCQPVKPYEFALILALHDLGKDSSLPKALQHQAALDIIYSHRHILPITDTSLSILATVIATDIIGESLKKSRCTKATEAERARIIQIWKEGRALSYEQINAFSSLSKVSCLQAERSGIIDRAAEEVRNLCRGLGTDPLNFFKMIKLYWQADTLAYTYDAMLPDGTRSFPALEYLYVLNPNFSPLDGSSLFAEPTSEGLVPFVPEVQLLFDCIESNLRF